MQTAILTFIIPIISLIFTAAFLALWWNDRRQWPVLAFGVCFASLALGVVINIWLIDRTEPSGIVAYHLVSMGGLLALMWGVGQRAEIKVPVHFCAFTVVLVSGLLWYTMDADLPDAMRLAQNTNSALLMAVTAASLWYGTKRNWADHTLVWVLVVMAAFGFIRPVLTQIFPAGPGGDGSAILILHSIHILALATLLTLIALCLIASIVVGTMQSEREKASTDPLTGLANRAAFEEQVDEVLEQARQENVPVSLLVGDIDNFKSVNDTWGHGAGDKVIATFGSLISNRIRPKDAVGRIGGEEFCLLIWNCSEPAAVSLANRLRLGFAHAAIAGFSSEQQFSVSFGVAQWEPGESYEQSFARADQALYAAKRAGRNRVEAAGLAATGSSSEAERDQSCVDSGSRPEGAQVVSFEKVKAGKPHG